MDLELDRKFMEEILASVPQQPQPLPPPSHCSDSDMTLEEAAANAELTEPADVETVGLEALRLYPVIGGMMCVVCGTIRPYFNAF